MTTPRVSIVVPVYNGEKYVAETLDSVLAQTYGNLQLIVVDDGSTDRTAGILSRYAGAVSLLAQENRGQSASLNRAWREAEGSIVGYISADDRLEPRAVEELVGILESSPECVMVYPDYWLIDAIGRKLKLVRAPEFSHASALIDGVCPVGPGALFRRTVLDQVGGWNVDLRQIPDREFILRAALCGEIRRHPVALARFRVHEASQTFAAPREDRIAEYEIAINSFFARADVPEPLMRHRHRAYANAMVLTARLHLLSGSRRRAWRSLEKATRHWRYWPTSRRNLKLLANGLLGVPGMRARNAVRAWLRLT